MLVMLDFELYYMYGDESRISLMEILDESLKVFEATVFNLIFRNVCMLRCHYSCFWKARLQWIFLSADTALFRKGR
jgi:hypothetical protein